MAVHKKQRTCSTHNPARPPSRSCSRMMSPTLPLLPPVIANTLARINGYVMVVEKALAIAPSTNDSTNPSSLFPAPSRPFFICPHGLNKAWVRLGQWWCSTSCIPCQYIHMFAARDRGTQTVSVTRAYLFKDGEMNGCFDRPQCRCKEARVQTHDTLFIQQFTHGSER